MSLQILKHEWVIVQFLSVYGQAYVGTVIRVNSFEQQVCIDDKGYHLGNTSHSKYSMYEVMNEIMREMVKDAIITQVSSFI